jgi:hypothetical protein
MITKDNLKFAFENLNAVDCQAIYRCGDYLAFELHFTNASGYSTLNNYAYDEDLDEELSSNGNMLIDKDAFLELYRESGANNKFINELI